MDPIPVIRDSHAVASPSLPEVHRSVIVPPGAGFWRKLLAFSGPGFLIAVGYMDPGNWATDIASGPRFAYQLISVLMISNLMAILVQALAARLGIAPQMDLAQPLPGAGEFVNPRWLKILAWSRAGIIAILNADLLVVSVRNW